MKANLIKSVVAGVSLLVLTSMSAKAAVYSLSTGNPDLSGFGTPFGSVNVSLNSGTSATITFTAASSGLYHYLFGDGGSVALNVHGSVTVDPITAANYTQPQTQGGAPQAPTFTVSSGNEDGFGPFNFALDNVDGYQHAVSSLTFTIHLTSGSWSSDTDVLTANSHNATVAAHIFVVNADGTWSNTGITGYAAGGTPGGPTPQVPDGGSTVALLGCGLAGIGMIGRKFRKS